MWPNVTYRGIRSVIQCINLTYVPTTVVVAVVVDGFFVGKFWFSSPYTVMAAIGLGLGAGAHRNEILTRKSYSGLV